LEGCDVVPTPPRPATRTVSRDAFPDAHEHPDEVTDELAYVRPADAVERDPSRRARRASKEAAAYLSARRRRLRHRLETEA
jgi:hypothetical protein